VSRTRALRQQHLREAGFEFQWKPDTPEFIAPLRRFHFASERRRAMTSFKAVKALLMACGLMLDTSKADREQEHKFKWTREAKVMAEPIWAHSGY
jgi:hypothetical protein